MSDFRKELEQVINRHSKENGSDTPDFILAEFLEEMLKVFDHVTRCRDAWYGHKSLRERLAIKDEPTTPQDGE